MRVEANEERFNKIIQSDNPLSNLLLLLFDLFSIFVKALGNLPHLLHTPGEGCSDVLRFIGTRSSLDIGCYFLDAAMSCSQLGGSLISLLIALEPPHPGMSMLFSPGPPETRMMKSSIKGTGIIAFGSVV